MVYGTTAKLKVIKVMECRIWKASQRLCVLSHSVVSDSCATPWIVARQTPLSKGFSRQEYWSGFLFPGDLLDSRIEPASPASPALAGDSLPLGHLRSPISETTNYIKFSFYIFKKEVQRGVITYSDRQLVSNSIKLNISSVKSRVFPLGSL